MVRLTLRIKIQKNDVTNLKFVFDNYGCRQLGSKRLYRRSLRPYTWKFWLKTHFHLPTTPSLYQKSSGSACHLKSLWLYAQFYACSQSFLFYRNYFPTFKLYFELQSHKKNGILGYCRRSHWIRFPYHSKGYMEDTGIGHSSSYLCTFQST